jgi:isoleucyl-tRNA synthetase
MQIKTEKTYAAAVEKLKTAAAAYYDTDSLVMDDGEYELTLEAASTSDGAQVALALITGGGFVLLDTAMTPELEAEGLARDVIRAIQDTRKSAGFDVSDRIALAVVCFAEEDAVALRSVSDVDVAGETLATSFTIASMSTHGQLEALEAQLASEWIASVAGGSPEHIARFDAGAFANIGAFVVSVERESQVVDV